ncbi:MAG: radical SAM family heme chaperone HemW [Candidatus Margulisiibacteriota bacterium]
MSFYIHIPFCKKKCGYCDFHSFSGREDQIDDYVDRLAADIENMVRPRHVAALRSIYIGGGTPTLLSIDHLKRILDPVKTQCIASPEISIEANPGTVNKEYLAELRKLGINRLSLGAQTFNDNHLKMLGRIHNSQEIYQAVRDARSAGFDNINLDLIYALPCQTLDEVRFDIKEALSLTPEHLSTYSLQIEKGTPLYRRVSTRPEDEDLSADMYEYIIDTLTANGYEHYEISNFARPGFRCKHNVNYWKNGNWIGIGDGAKSNEDKEGKNTLFLGLRMLEGLPKEKFAGYEKEVAELRKDGLLAEENGNYKLTRKGLFLANLVFEKFV